MRFQFLAIASSMAVCVVSVPKATAQIPFLPQLQAPSSVSNDSDNRVVSGWIYLDGRRLFQIAASRTNFPERSEDIQKKLEKIGQNYFQSPAKTAIKVEVRKVNELPVIYVNDQYLMTVTSEDAGLRQVDISTSANQVAESLQEDLQQAKQERQTQSLIDQGKIATGTGVIMVIMSLGLYGWQRRSQKDSSVNPIASQPPRELLNSPISPAANQPITTQLNQQQKKHLQEVKRRLFQLSQAGIWGGGSFFILGLFPYTRGFQIGILNAFQFPLRLGVVCLGIYVAIRLTYALIDRFASTLISSGAFLTPESSARLQLRVSTFSGVTKSITTAIWIGVGFLLALVSLGIDIVPLLAGASLVGVALSLASQNLIKDAINGFLIILEDQYALGDVINVGDVGGLVENLNLRMTQVRDSEGRLITIPNGEIKVVANLSSRWSRADLTVPIAYQANTEEALKLIETVAFEMNQEMQWQRQILEPPQVLGIDQFGDRGLIIRVWIKTQPLKQWDVAREFRRRLKVALDEAGISISVPQQAIWVNDEQSLNFQGNGKTH
ncbi:mechanosensitive ion channel protein MscS [Nostoc sp. 'Peltigera membranacea cyanobiont' 213]|uniref:mechanosensitive ion channel family protein n=1 Tax=Nostoc sp. 'Peltigera membranacea cyanobiont' 213 TaxID=2014530 RepID=UPI000B959624|nr:mechanosensitive ion channel family protein [Nostoc sp. 'Peltigera membranacea cyanobiont' 213]OYD96994.1 mechanosensitive ion channel protein MscS [Nostoc sp. 'Peltigera membranacea cyanobiont' 213]